MDDVMWFIEINFKRIGSYRKFRETKYVKQLFIVQRDYNLLQFTVNQSIIHNCN